MRLKSCLLAACFAATAYAPVSAATLFQSVPDLSANPQINGLCSSCNGRFQVYDSFSLTQSANVESIIFAASSWYGFPGPVTLSFHENQDVVPGRQIAAFTFSPESFGSVQQTEFDTALVTLNLPTPVSLAGGTTYWVSFFNPSQLAIPVFAGGSGQLVHDTDGVIVRRDTSAGFAIEGAISAIPEPSAWAMMLVGFGGVGFAMRRAKRVTTGPAFA